MRHISLRRKSYCIHCCIPLRVLNSFRQLTAEMKNAEAAVWRLLYPLFVLSHPCTRHVELILTFLEAQLFSSQLLLHESHFMLDGLQLPDLLRQLLLQGREATLQFR